MNYIPRCTKRRDRKARVPLRQFAWWAALGWVLPLAAHAAGPAVEPAAGTETVETAPVPSPSPSSPPATPRPVEVPPLPRHRDGRNLTAVVESVSQGKFPSAVIRMKVSAPARVGPGAGFAAGTALTMIPRYRIEKGVVLMTDPDTLTNACSFYLLPGDRVSVRPGERHDNSWDADYIERF